MASREAYITGVGQSQIGQKLTRHPLLLTLDAFKEALGEAGLTVGQIDGVATYPGKTPTYLGNSPLSVDDVIEGLGLKPRWRLGAAETTAQLGAIAAAADAVKAGHARHVMCFRTIYEAAAISRPEEYPPRRSGRLEGFSQWVAPFGAASAANWIARRATPGDTVSDTK